MRLKDGLYRAGACLKHRLTAKHTLGYGIHSPYLYYIVHFLFYDDNTYYCFSDIEKERARLLRATKSIYVQDYGTGTSSQRELRHIAATSLMPRREAQLLFRLLLYLKPKTVVELGTSLGITTSYLQKAVPHARVYTFEGSEAVAKEAEHVFEHLNLPDVHLVKGNIDDTLPAQLQNLGTIDFALLDANHTEDATLRYFAQIVEKCGQKSVVVLDDIHYSASMGRAWKQIKKHPKVVASMDLYGMGIVFFDRQLLKQHYIIRV